MYVGKEGYPFLIPSDCVHDCVHGVLQSFPNCSSVIFNSLLSYLDMVEGCPDEYFRSTLKVFDSNGVFLDNAFVYLPNQKIVDLSSSILVKSGNFLDFLVE